MATKKAASAAKEAAKEPPAQRDFAHAAETQTFVGYSDEVVAECRKAAKVAAQS